MTTQPSFDSMEFRRTLGSFTTGVTIITARGADGQPVGVTANSFSSVSLDPPLVLWSLARNARSLAAFEAAEYFAVHILSAGQQDLSNRFASRGEDKFIGVDVEEGLGGTPLLPGSCARMQCRTVHRYDGGDHIIFVGEVVDLTSSAALPLAFQAGKYALAGRKASDTPLVQSSGSEFKDDFLGYLLWRSYFQFYSELRKSPAIRSFTDDEFVLISTLAHNNWRTAAGLQRAMFDNETRAAVDQALQSLQEKGVVEQRDEAGCVLYGLSPAGMERALEVLAAAKSTEATLLDRLGLWDGAALCNLLRGFIDTMGADLPHPWERAEDEAHIGRPEA